MATERADDLKALMHDNATFIQFPPIGSSTSLITVFGDHRVNIQRTIRSIMQLVRRLDVKRVHRLNLLSGLSILRRLALAVTCTVQCAVALRVLEPHAGCDDPEASFLHQRRRSRVQGHELRDAWP